MSPTTVKATPSATVMVIVFLMLDETVGKTTSQVKELTVMFAETTQAPVFRLVPLKLFGLMMTSSVEPGGVAGTLPPTSQLPAALKLVSPVPPDTPEPFQV